MKDENVKCYLWGLATGAIITLIGIMMYFAGEGNGYDQGYNDAKQQLSAYETGLRNR